MTATLKGPVRGKTKPLAGSGYDISEHSCQPLISDTGRRQQLNIQLEQQRKHANEHHTEDVLELICKKEILLNKIICYGYFRMIKLSKTNIIPRLTFLPSARSGFCVVLEKIYIFCLIHHCEVEFRATTKNFKRSLKNNHAEVTAIFKQNPQLHAIFSQMGKTRKMKFC